MTTTFRCGHPRTEENSYTRAKGRKWGRCRICQLARVRNVEPSEVISRSTYRTLHMQHAKLLALAARNFSRFDEMDREIILSLHDKFYRRKT